MRTKPNELLGDVDKFLGEFLAAVPSGAVTTIAAGTGSAGHLLAFRWGDTGGNKMALRYLAAQFCLTTAFGAAQEVGCEAFVARSFTASSSGGTAITLTTNNNKRRKGGATSLVTDARVATTAALTAGTLTLDAQAFGSTSGWAGAAGVVIAKTVLFDARDTIHGESGIPTRSPIILEQDEGFVVRNTVLMGASGVGRWQFFAEWDEIKP